MKSPCKNRCNYNFHIDMCESCGRTLEQIQFWGSYTDEERDELIEIAEERLNENKLD